MRFLTMLAILPLAAFGRTLSVPALPPPVFADTEVSACHPLNQSGEAVNRLDFHLDFNGTPSNNVEVAFGTDANGDRSPSLDETDVVIGWECGRYFIERYRTGDRFDEASVVGPSGSEFRSSGEPVTVRIAATEPSYDPGVTTRASS